MFQLVPAWASHYDDFWKTISGRNLWFIKLRYGAVIMLGALLFTAELFLDISFSPEQFKAIILITLLILAYNLFFHYIRGRLDKLPGKINSLWKINPLHLSLLQMVLDLYSLTMLVYYTGTIETPLYMLFVFHVIIGSFILPGFIIYSITATIIIIFSSLSYLEYFTVITHHSVEGLLKAPLYNELNYVASFTTVFAFVMVISVLLSNRIAKQLYKMEQDLLESFDKLNKAEIEKQKYIIGVVHEIKNPLTAVHSYLNIILQKILGPLDSKIEEKLKRASIRSEEAVNLTNNILKISKLRLLDQISFEKIDINKIICDSINKNNINISSKNIKLNYRDNRIKVIDIYGDPLMIELAISNLMSNAFKYVRKDGSVIVSVNDADNGLPRLGGAKTGIEIEVCDNGVGIPAGEIEKIFHEFYRASNIGENLEGSGLGLSIVKLIVESHNGTIKAESPSRIGTKENPGTSFKIFLPSNVEKV